MHTLQRETFVAIFLSKIQDGSNFGIVASVAESVLLDNKITKSTPLLMLSPMVKVPEGHPPYQVSFHWTKLLTLYSGLSWNILPLHLLPFDSTMGAAES